MPNIYNVVKLGDGQRLADDHIFRPIYELEGNNNEGYDQSESGQNLRVQEAFIYGKAALIGRLNRNPTQSDNKGISFEVAFADFLNAPDIHVVDLSSYSGRVGSQIFITISEAFAAKSIFVKIQNIDGQNVEAGFAEQGLFKTEWTFSASNNNPNFKGDKISITAS